MFILNVATEVSVLGDDQKESMEALSQNLERLAINPVSSLYQPSSDAAFFRRSRQLMIALAKPHVHKTPKPPDNTDEGKVVALQWFVDKCSIGPLGSIM